MAKASQKEMLAAIVMPVRADLQAVSAAMRGNLSTDVLLVDQVVHHALLSFGKQLRPTLLLLVCHALGGGQQAERISLAASVELIHTATLLHDDVVDDSDLRRGSSTANIVFGNAASVLVGDFLYSRAFQLMLDGRRLEVLERLANATNLIAEGEVMQLSAVADFSLTQERYFELIRRKTGVLFSAAAAVGAMLGKYPALCAVAERMGDCLGIAFQLMDDLLDYLGDSQELGKNAGDDTRGGRVTLPMILAMQSLAPEQRRELEAQVQHDAAQAFTNIQGIIRKTGADQMVFEKARTLVNEARELLGQFPDNEYRQALLGLCAFSLIRQA